MTSVCLSRVRSFRCADVSLLRHDDVMFSFSCFYPFHPAVMDKIPTRDVTLSVFHLLHYTSSYCMILSQWHRNWSIVSGMKSFHGCPIGNLSNHDIIKSFDHVKCIVFNV